MMKGKAKVFSESLVFIYTT